MPDTPTYMTEALLTIQNELQTAVDYVETVAAREATVGGASPSLVTIDTMKVVVPVVLEPEHQEHEVLPGTTPPLNNLAMTASEIADAKDRLLSRRGLALSKVQNGKATFAKMLCKTVSSTNAPTTGNGTIEVTFVRVARSIEDAPAASDPPVASDPPPASQPTTASTVPSLVGQSFKTAKLTLESLGWTVKAHAGTPPDEEVQRLQGLRGRVWRQLPEAGSLAQKSAPVELWVWTSTLPAILVEGIGKRGEIALESVGIANVGALSIA